MEEVFQGSRKGGGQSRSVGGQGMKEQRQKPRKVRRSYRRNWGKVSDAESRRARAEQDKESRLACQSGGRAEASRQNRDHGMQETIEEGRLVGRDGHFEDPGGSPLVNVLLCGGRENSAGSRPLGLWQCARAGPQILLMSLCLPWALWLSGQLLSYFSTVEKSLPSSFASSFLLSFL